MFISQSDYEFPFPVELTEPGTHFWRAVELSLNATWFVATLCSIDRANGFRRTLLVSWDTDLVQIQKGLIGGYLEALILMVPAQSDAGGRWISHRITQIWRASDADRGDEPVLLFTTTDGQHLHGQLAEPAAETMCGRQLLITVGQIPADPPCSPSREPKVAKTIKKAKKATPGSWGNCSH